MKRRDFISTLGMGALASTTLPALQLENNQDSQKQSNSPDRQVYQKSCIARSGIALGGIGTGSIELRQDGNFYNWRIFNNRPAGLGPSFNIKHAPETGFDMDRSQDCLFFVVRYQVEGQEPQLRLLNHSQNLDRGGIWNYTPEYIFPWLKTIKTIGYEASFPFTNLEFTDPDMPLVISMEAFSPFIPHDVENSSIPGAYFNFSIKSLTHKPVDVMLIASLRNVVGYHTNDKFFTSELIDKDGYKYFNLSAGGMDKRMTNYGNMGIASLHKDSSYYLGWGFVHPYYPYVLRHKHLPNLDDTNGTESIRKTHPETPDWLPDTPGRNITDPNSGKKQARPDRKSGEQVMFSSIARSVKLQGHEEVKHSFVLSWYFPNAYQPKDRNSGLLTKDYQMPDYDQLHRTGHYYENKFGSAADVADYLINKQEELTTRSRRFHDDFFCSQIPDHALKLINSQFNTLITNSWYSKDTAYRICDDGGLIGSIRYPWYGFNTDLGIYSNIAFTSLFPELEKSMLRVMKKHEDPKKIHGMRPDHPLNYVQLVIKHFFFTNNKAFLKEFWPSLVEAIDFTLETHDTDKDGIPEIYGAHNCSYDNIGMYGKAPYILSQWLCALKSMEEAATILGNQTAAKKYAKDFKKAQTVMIRELWTGNYFRLYNDDNKGANSGCLSDQLLGQWVAELSGLGKMIDDNKTNTALKTILKNNYIPHFGLINLSWPDQDKEFWWSKIDPEQWIDQVNTPWSGVEPAFASFLLYQGEYKQAMALMNTVYQRHIESGLLWNFQEAGGHYTRSLSAVAVINGLLGMSINQLAYSFAPAIPQSSFKVLFMQPSGTAFYHQNTKSISIECRSGKLQLKSLKIATSCFDNQNIKLAVRGQETEADISSHEQYTIIEFGKTITLNVNDMLTLNTQ